MFLASMALLAATHTASPAAVPPGEQAACAATLAYHAAPSQRSAVRALRLIYLSRPTGPYAKYFKTDLGDYVLTGTYFKYAKEDCG